MLGSIPTGTTWATGLGATIATGAVLDSYRRIRAARRRAVGARFAWIARVYERARGAFVHGAILGALLGLGLLPGPWAATARLARLETRAAGRTLAYNVGVVTILCGGLLDQAGADGSVVTRIGWGLVVMAVLHLALGALSPSARSVPDPGARPSRTRATPGGRRRSRR